MRLTRRPSAAAGRARTPAFSGGKKKHSAKPNANAWTLWGYSITPTAFVQSNSRIGRLCCAIAQLFEYSMSRCLRWCFTLNNFTHEEEESLHRFGSDRGRCRFIIIGREHLRGSGQPAGSPSSGPEDKTPHLQGYFELYERSRITKLKRIDGLGRAHLEVAAGSAEENVKYCSKDDPHPFSSGEFNPGQGDAGGKKTQVLYAEAIEHAKLGNFDAIDAGIRLRCHRSLRAVYDEAQWRLAESRVCSPDIVLRPWQVQLEDLIWTRPHDREIRVFCDPKGGAGKTTYAAWLYHNYGFGRPCGRPRGDHQPPTVQVLHPSRGMDMAYLIKPASVYVLDIPRASVDYLPWATIEEVKNGFLTSTKYECQPKRFPIPHVIVFSNQPILPGTFSEDRLVVEHLSVLE